MIVAAVSWMGLRGAHPQGLGSYICGPVYLFGHAGRLFPLSFFSGDSGSVRPNLKNQRAHGPDTKGVASPMAAIITGTGVRPSMLRSMNEPRLF